MDWKQRWNLRRTYNADVEREYSLDCYANQKVSISEALEVPSKRDLENALNTERLGCCDLCHYNHLISCPLYSPNKVDLLVT